MSFMDLEKAAEKFGLEPMKGNIERLKDFDLYHCLLAGSIGVSMKVQKRFPTIPAEYVNWLKLCNGGLLFDTVILSTKAHDDELDLDFDTYDELNTEEAVSGFGLPSGYAVFAIRSYGDPICFNANENDGKVYLWNCDEGEFTDIWDSFTDWLTEEIDTGIKLIADDCLEPLGIKFGGDDDE